MQPCQYLFPVTIFFLFFLGGFGDWRKGGETGGNRRTHPPHDFHVCGPGSIAGCDGIHDTQDISLHHAHKVEVVFALGHVAEVLDEVHDVCSIVHGILMGPRWLAFWILEYV